MSKISKCHWNCWPQRAPYLFTITRSHWLILSAITNYREPFERQHVSQWLWVIVETIIKNHDRLNEALVLKHDDFWSKVNLQFVDKRNLWVKEFYEWHNQRNIMQTKSYRISMKVKKVETKEFNENATKSKNANSYWLKSNNFGGYLPSILCWRRLFPPLRTKWSSLESSTPPSWWWIVTGLLHIESRSVM